MYSGVKLGIRVDCRQQDPAGAGRGSVGARKEENPAGAGGILVEIGHYAEGALCSLSDGVTSPPGEDICKLEQWAEVGGWGFESLQTQVAKARARLADNLLNHSVPDIRGLWASGRWTS